MASELAFLTDEELRKKLRSFKLTDGPITKTTRKLFEAKLARAMAFEKETDDKLSVTQPKQRITDINGDYVNITATKTFPSDTQSVKGATDGQGGVIFYGVCVQVDINGSDNQNNVLDSACPVFTDKLDALQCVKKNNGARFRAFSSRNDAVAFAKGNIHTPTRLPSQELSSGPAEPISDYKSLKPAEITKFRKLIENGDGAGVSKAIYSNPKYLISSVDKPVIVQEGCHYNSMHVASKAGHKDICECIVNALNDDALWEMLYPSREKNVNCDHLGHWRKKFLLDLYLNTPDKGVSRF